MKSLIIGAIILVIAGFYSVSGEQAHLYYNSHSMWLVGAGTVAIFFLTVPMGHLLALGRSLKGMLLPETKFQSFLPELTELAKNKHASVKSTNGMIAYASQLWEQGISHDLFIVLLSEKRGELGTRAMDGIHALKNLAKYPPALGMVGTVMGMIDLFSALDANQDKIGASLSVAMTATFLGLVISNFVISPIGDRLHVQHVKDQRLNTEIYEILLLIHNGEAFALVDEEIKSRAA